MNLINKKHRLTIPNPSSNYVFCAIIRSYMFYSIIFSYQCIYIEEQRQDKETNNKGEICLSYSLRTAMGRSRSSTSATRVAPSAWMALRCASPTESTMGTDMLIILPSWPRMALK